MDKSELCIASVVRLVPWHHGAIAKNRDEGKEEFNGVSIAGTASVQ